MSKLPNNQECPQCKNMITWDDLHHIHTLQCPKCRYRKKIPIWISFRQQPFEVKEHE